MKAWYCVRMETYLHDTVISTLVAGTAAVPGWKTPGGKTLESAIFSSLSHSDFTKDVCPQSVGKEKRSGLGQ